MKVLGYGASHCSFTPPDFYTSAGERQGEQQFCNIITIFHVATKITARWKVGIMCVFPEGILRVQRGKKETKQGEEL